MARASVPTNEGFAGRVGAREDACTQAAEAEFRC